MIYDLIVVGGGAAGFFGAIQAAEMKSQLRMAIVEKSPKLLSKVRVSGGGRCNVTHSCFEPRRLAAHYPRGEKTLKNIFKIYQATDVVKWFKEKGVPMNAEEDGRMFPVSNDSQTVIDCFLGQARAHSIEIITGSAITSAQRIADHFQIQLVNGGTMTCRYVLIATGGSPNKSAYDWIQNLGHNIIAPIPSLFTLNDPAKKFQDLMGISVNDAEIKIAGTKFSMRGPLLITHWGLSGPAVIRLSAWAAEYLFSKQYDVTVLVSWIGPANEDSLRITLSEFKISRRKQKVVANPLFNLPHRLWLRLCEVAEIEDERLWGELPLKKLNKLIENLIRCPFDIKGKTTFKEEFVTCGGVDLNNINPVTMESLAQPGVYFAGEVLNIDGETGGFNFQSAWSTAFIAAKAITMRLR
jgi:predicted Rossmann fold flavoprotein